MLSQEPGGTLPTGLLERDGAGWGGQSRGQLPCTEPFCSREGWSCSPGAAAPKAGQRGLAPWLGEGMGKVQPPLAYGNQLAVGNSLLQRAALPRSSWEWLAKLS